MKRIFIAGLLCTSSTALGWGFHVKLSNFDPFNKNSVIRHAARVADPVTLYKKSQDNIVTKVGKNIGSMAMVEKHAEEQGWTTDKCRVAGLGLFTSIAAFQGTAICAACVAGEPVSTGVCVSMVVGAGGVITEVACTTLCHNRKLRDCK